MTADERRAAALRAEIQRLRRRLRELWVAEEFDFSIAAETQARIHRLLDHLHKIEREG